MTRREIERTLETLVIVVDTREHKTARLRKRIEQMGVPSIVKKLDFGDYSAVVTLPDGSLFSLEKSVCIERKADLSEICNNFKDDKDKTKSHRDRFAREFERARIAGAKMHLLIENATWEKVLQGQYRSLMKPKALLASLLTWSARYNCGIFMCESGTSGTLIKEVLFREMKEKLVEQYKT